MTYYPYRSRYELTEREQKIFGLREVSIMTDGDTGSGAVLNHPENEFLAGDLLTTRKNPHYDPDLPTSSSNRYLTTAFSDGYNVALSNTLAGARIASENRNLDTVTGTFAVIAASLPQLHGIDESTRTTVERSLRSVADEFAGVFNTQKKTAIEEIEQAYDALSGRHVNAPKIAKWHVMKAAELLLSRQTALRSQTTVNEQRHSRQRRESQADEMAKRDLSTLYEAHGTIANHEDRFIKIAHTRFFKPGNLTVNNVWYRRNDPDSIQYLRVAQEGFEPLYGFLMKPMSQLAAEPYKKIAESVEQQGALAAKYCMKLVKLEDVVDMVIRVGKDYESLGERLRETVFHVEQMLLDGSFKEAIQTAKDYRMLLRYRALLGGTTTQQRDDEEVLEQAKEVWYGELPELPTYRMPSDLLDELKKNPFKGLS